MSINRHTLTTEIRQTCIELIGSIERFNESQFNTVPFQGGWTCGQVAEHLLLSAGGVEVIAGQTSPTQRPADEKTGALAAIFLDLNIKLQSPDFIVPAPGPYDKAEMMTKLRTAWTRIDQAVCLLDLTVTCVDADFPGLGALTRLEWIKFYIFHTQRHQRQINRIYDGLSLRPGQLRHPRATPDPSYRAVP
jgi:hypothetical protein